MMMRKKSNKWSAAKSLVALPVSLLAVSLFAHPLVANGLTEISEVKVMENSPEIKTESPISVVENSDTLINSQKEKVIYIVNDKVMDAEVAKSIAPEKIASITVVKNGALNETYGLPDNKGVILIELKKGDEVASTPTPPVDGQKPAAVYLKVLRDSADVSPDQIESIHVYKKVSKSIANHFGVAEGEDVIEILTKKE